MLVIPRSVRKAMLSALIAESGFLDGAIVKLYKNAVNPSDFTAIGSLTECDFTGYADSAAITWGTVSLDVNNRAVVLGDRKEFPCSGTATPNTVYGAYITTGDGLTLLGIMPFDSPIQVASSDDVVSVVPEFALPWELPEQEEA